MESISMMMPSLEQIAHGITQEQAFLPHTDDLDAVSKTINSLVNTKGGVLWLGVKTSRKINGVDPETVRLLMTQLNETVFTRPIDFQFESFQVDMKRVVAISVVESTHKPIELITNNQQKTAYFRVDGQVLEATKIVLNVWKLQAINALNSLQAEFDEQLFQRVRNEQPVTLSQLYRFFSNDLSTVDKSLSFLIAKKRLDFTLIKEQLCYKVME